MPNQPAFFRAAAKWNRTIATYNTDAGIFNVTVLKSGKTIVSRIRSHTSFLLIIITFFLDPTPHEIVSKFDSILDEGGGRGLAGTIGYSSTVLDATKSLIPQTLWCPS